MTLYIYAIAQADGAGVDLPKGIAGQPVFRIASGSLGAFVSEYQGTTIRAERRHIAAIHKPPPVNPRARRDRSSPNQMTFSYV